MRRAAGFILVAAVAGCQLTPPDRVSGYGFRSQPGNLVFHWPSDRLPVKYWAEAKGAVPDYVEEGIREWEDQFLYGEFQGSLRADSAGADVLVFLGGTAPPASPLTSAPPVDACSGRTSLTVGADNKVVPPITISLSWFAGFTAEQVANCLARVTTHEIGHTLGLLQHSDQATDIMYGAPAGQVKVSDPSPRDRSTIQELYHTKADVSP